MFHNKEYIYTVYQEQSFSKAAKKLYVTQPCLSAMVKKTEIQLGVPIFDRSSKPIQLTEYGEKYIEYIERVMLLEQQLGDYLNDVRGLKTGHISIGANNVCSSFVLPELMKRFSDCYPEVGIELHEGNVNYLEEQMSSGALDVVLDNYPVDLRLYHTFNLCTEHLLIAVPEAMLQQNPVFVEKSAKTQSFTAKDIAENRHLQKNSSSLTMEDFACFPFIILRKGNDTRKRYEHLCMNAHVNLQVLLEVDQLSTAYNITCSKAGATLISDTLVKKMPVTDVLRFYSISSELMERKLFFHYPRNQYVKLAVKKFMEEATMFYQ